MGSFEGLFLIWASEARQAIGERRKDSLLVRVGNSVELSKLINKDAGVPKAFPR